jgi:hypothetical protein
MPAENIIDEATTIAIGVKSIIAANILFFIFAPNP